MCRVQLFQIFKCADWNECGGWAFGDRVKDVERGKKDMQLRWKEEIYPINAVGRYNSYLILVIKQHLFPISVSLQSQILHSSRTLDKTNHQTTFYQNASFCTQK